MCATYGFFENPFLTNEQEWGVDLPPLQQPNNARRMRGWMHEQAGRARITGKNARNLNPLVVQRDGERALEFAWWWLHVGNRPAKFTAFNARVETLDQKWRQPFQHRAIAPAAWFDEKGQRFALEGRNFGMAAVTTTASLPDGSQLRSYALVTRPALGVVEPVRNRMPLILPRDLHDEWLNPARVGDAAFAEEASAASEELSRELQLVEEFQPGAQEAPTLF